MSVTIARNLLLLLASSSIPASVYFHGWYGLVVSVIWGSVGALIGVYGMHKGAKLRNPKAKMASGIELTGMRYAVLTGIIGMATCAVESWLSLLEWDNTTQKRVSAMTGANLLLLLVSGVLGYSVKVEE
eukprot:TRINITY_DN25769_c0_g1_i1.p2 TRINITY_DN25769_c0_g1~~TRINITY_DN25769_c0_g1_i1.p2  ORF type:complete len:129 (+),score=26.63 TRINITY_DN25769_c0_g1_i1:29-415(+)